ncbi:hypothetical protein EXE46_02205 [Halorubrum sp. GN11_10-6_MGM]|uniref:hypothetical protein n=1 Tax=Halorubrum sp. GN11_10-6_MGM TaxID=2518112 RepID=UPI0010F841B2|nr:hypothetical protein [Halorubrum sp. GN11_10-6_MGM]TKX75931.1 hypothetical protein EXE46_02205 [Halorubrum sp. GN11_10-6_MGM]
MSDGDRSDDENATDSNPFDDDLFRDESSDEADDSRKRPDAGAVDDPFAALGEGIDDGAGRASASENAEATPRSDPDPSAPADDPFAELDADASGAPTDEDPFESMGSGDVGEEDVWEALDEGTPIGADAAEVGDAGDSGAVGDAEALGSRAAGSAPGAGATGDERVVDKRSYCQQCPHFTAPPETACTHEGTDIVESVDFSRFRVRNCPMVDADDPAFGEE